MQCPFCSEPDTRVIDSRLAAEGSQVRRRRECNACSERFTTYESAELVMPHVRKRGKEKQVVPFNENKLRLGMEAALFKRPVTPEQLDTALSHILHKLRTTGERVVPSQQIGEWVMDELRDIDEVAYVRFASIYRRFRDADEMRALLERLEEAPGREFREQQLNLIDNDDKS